MNWFDYYHEFDECIEFLEAFKKMACINPDELGPRLYAQFVRSIDIWDIFEYIKENHGFDSGYFYYNTFDTLDERVHAIYYNWLDAPDNMIYVKAGESVNV